MVGFSDITNRVEIDFSSIDKNKTMVILAYGQGNAANGGEVKYTPKHNVYNVFSGKCYKADDPLLGATNYYGSVWGRLADKLVENGLYENVIIKSIGVGGTPIICWTTDGTGIGYKERLFGNYHSRIIEAHIELESMGFPISHIFWHQGETDTVNGTKTSEYKEHFMNMLNNMRKQGIKAPVFVAIASRYGNLTSNEVTCAQQELIKENEDILEGPNTDTIDSIEDRTSDGQRFSETGLEKHAELWLDSIKQARNI